jgi:prepilin-type N-terminal cleavage/methylation domain-containing protein/prepilin-type processing-associated H-X9-DG protein
MRGDRAGRSGRPRGFTLIELVVVIGIIILLMAIMIPIATRLVAGQQLQGCQMRMNKLGQALRMYRLDEGGFPPYRVANGEIRGRGLLALLDTGHLRSREALRCPSDDRDYASECTTYNTAAFGYGPKDPISYMWMDADAAHVAALPAFKYLSDRALVPGDRDVNRVPYDGRGTNYQPDDSTVLTWCNYHSRVVTEAGRGQYMVLFYDGHVERMDATLLRTGDVGQTPPEEAWRVWPGQRGWLNGAPTY